MAEPRRDPRRLAVIVVVIVAAVGVALVVVGGRSRGGGHATNPGQIVPVASRTAPVPSPALSAAPGGAGPTTVVNGVPMGYAHTPDGARAAAMNFLRLDQALSAMADDTSVATAKRTITASSVTDALVANVTKKVAAVRRAFPAGPVRFRIGEVATKVTPADADHVRVEIWNVGIASPPGMVPYEDWSIQRYDLVWERDDWRDAAEVSTPGPVPQRLASTTASGTGQLEGALAGFATEGQAR